MAGMSKLCTFHLCYLVSDYVIFLLCFQLWFSFFRCVITLILLKFEYRTPERSTLGSNMARGIALNHKQWLLLLGMREQIILSILLSDHLPKATKPLITVQCQHGICLPLIGLAKEDYELSKSRGSGRSLKQYPLDYAGALTAWYKNA